MWTCLHEVNSAGEMMQELPSIVRGIKRWFKYRISTFRNYMGIYYCFLDIALWPSPIYCNLLTHWGRVMHICGSKLTIIGLDNGLSPEQCQAIIWTSAEILLIGTLGTNFSEILMEIQTFSLKKLHLKMSSAKCCSCRLGLNELSYWSHIMTSMAHSFQTKL